jgi:hypothetical protein
MGAAVEREEGNVWRLRVSGVLRRSELDAAQAALRREIERTGAVNILVTLEGFRGWERGADWGDVSFATSHGDRIGRMAFAGDPRWETEALMFVGAGFRRTRVMFFPPENLAGARAWLSEKDDGPGRPPPSHGPP